MQYFNPQMDFFRHYSEDADRTDCLSFFFVGNMVEDKRGDIWICTEGGGLNHLNRKTRQFTHYLAGGQSSAPSFYNLKCIEYDPVRDYLYVGTHKQGFVCFDITTGRIKYHTEEMGTSLSKITLRGDSLYILSGKGMLVKNLQTGITNYLYPSIPETNKGGTSFLIDSYNYIWIAQRDQIIRINMQNPEEKYYYKYGEKGLGKFLISEIAEYRRYPVLRNLWVGPV